MSPVDARKGERNVHFREAGGFVLTALYDGDRLAPGVRITGPAVAELSATTVVVRPGQSLRVDCYRNFIVERERP